MVLFLVQVVHALCVQYLLREGHMFNHFLRLQVSPLFRLHKKGLCHEICE